MLVKRKYVDEWGNEIVNPKVSGDVPTPEKGVLNAKFSLTRLPVLSDDDVNKAAKRRKKGKKQMTDIDQEEDAKRGRTPKYVLDLTAQGVSVSDENLTKDQKDDDGKVIKTHTVVSKSIVVTDLNGAMGLFAADEAKLWEFLSEAATAYHQRTDRQRLVALSQGPEKDMVRAINSLVDAGFDKQKARNLIRAQFASEMNINVSDEELDETEKKMNEARAKAKAAREAKEKK